MIEIILHIVIVIQKSLNQRRGCFQIEIDGDIEFEHVLKFKVHWLEKCSILHGTLTT